MAYNGWLLQFSVDMQLEQELCPINYPRIEIIPNVIWPHRENIKCKASNKSIFPYP